MIVADERLLETVRSEFRERVVKINRPQSQFPQLVVDVPDSWESIQLAPLFDVHYGSRDHDEELFTRHLRWIQESPNVLSWNGGDLIENATKLSVGAGVYEQDFDPTNQMVRIIVQLAAVRHKMLFALPGNHEDRASIVGLDVGRLLATMLEIPYFPDYSFTTLRWRGNNFRILAHHGSGSATTAGAQRMAARKDLGWAKPFDLYWSGHLHAALVDVLFQTDFDQSSGQMVERNGMVVISPSYVRYFGSYAAKKRYPPGTRGLAVVELREDGRMDATIHARGKRL